MKIGLLLVTGKGIIFIFASVNIVKVTVMAGFSMEVLFILVKVVPPIMDAIGKYLLIRAE